MKTLNGFLLISLMLLTVSCKDKAKESQKLVREANVFLYVSNVDKAMEYFDKAAKLDPKNAEAWYGIGMVWMNKMKYEKAIEYFERAIGLKPDYTDAYYNRGQAYFYLGENFRACEDWNIAYDLGKPNMVDKLKKCR